MAARRSFPPSRNLIPVLALALAAGVGLAALTSNFPRPTSDLYQFQTAHLLSCWKYDPQNGNRCTTGYGTFFLAYDTASIDGDTVVVHLNPDAPDATNWAALNGSEIKISDGQNWVGGCSAFDYFDLELESGDNKRVQILDQQSLQNANTISHEWGNVCVSGKALTWRDNTYTEFLGSKARQFLTYSLAGCQPGQFHGCATMSESIVSTYMQN